MNNFVLLQEFVIETTPEAGDTVEITTENAEETVDNVDSVLPDQPQYQDNGDLATVTMYQDTTEHAQFYSETVDTGHLDPLVVEVTTEQPKPMPRIKNKRTVAAVSNEDKRLALNAMEELRSRGATTDDLMCRLCDPARPFTAYSTLLTHYRSVSSTLID